MQQSEKTKRAFKGVWICREIWLNRELSWMEKLFLAEIDSLDNKRGCFASNSYFGDFFDLSCGRASEIINSLIKKEYLTVEYVRDGKEIKERILKMTNKYKEENTGGYSENRIGYSENTKEITKYNNKGLLLRNKEAISEKSPSFKTDLFVEGWNSLKEKFPMLQEHRKPSTKIYQNAVKLIRHLKFGTFGDMCHVDHDFRERNHISQKLLSKKWTETEIKQTIEKLPLFFLKGYFPYNKETLPKDLPNLIFNPRTGSSWFLMAYAHPPVPMKQGKSDTQIDNEIQHSVKKNKPISIEEFLENDEMSSILK
jgi:hypothetical protein